MGRLFTVSRPNLAGPQRVLMFVALVMICADWITLSPAFSELLAAESRDLGIPEALLLWTILGIIVSAAYLGVMVTVDRLLKVRKGFALLYVVAVLAWALVGAGLSSDIARLLSLDPIPPAFAWKIALFAAFASTLINVPSLRIALSGRGFHGPQPADEPPTGSLSPSPDDEPTQLIVNPQDRDAAPLVRRGATLLTWASIVASVTLGYAVFSRNLDSTIRLQDDPAPFPGAVTPPGERTPVARLHLPDEPVHLPDEPPQLPRIVTLGSEGPPFRGRHLQNDPAPFPRVVTPGAGASATRRKDGYFAFNAMVNGQPASMLFDTGASVVAIRSEDAERFVLPVNTLKFSVRVLTANGTGTGAAATIDTLTVGTITQHRVQAIVASPGALNENLLGQSFLKNLRQVNVENNQVVLKAD